MERTDKGRGYAEAEAREIEAVAALPLGLPWGLPWERPTWRKAAWWACALLALSGAALLMYAYPAFAQAGGEVDTCAGGDGAGGEGGQKILDGIRNAALFGAALIGSLSVLGILASAGFIILGSGSKDWQRRGTTGLVLCAVGIFVALGATALYGAISSFICG